MRSPSPTLQTAACDLDLSRLDDEQLVVLAQEYGFDPARTELLQRCHALIVRFIRRYAVRAGLQDADYLDAQQDAVLWTVEAIRCYKMEEQAKAEGCHFRSFLHRVVTARFIDFLRHRHRQQIHFPLAGAPPRTDVKRESKQGAEVPAARTDPEQNAEWSELLTRLHQQLERLSPTARQLWELLAEGVSLRKVAVVLNLSYDAVKRRRRKLFAELRSSLETAFRKSN